MDVNSTRLSYAETGYFSKIVIDYLNEKEELSPFFKHPVSGKGITDAITAREAAPPDRNLLVAELKTQYKLVTASEAVDDNIEKLLLKNTFTVCTAHQPAIFTGTLYFIYKILHTIRLSDSLKSMYPDKHFVPVFFMGSEDADLDELGKIYLGNEKIVWNTNQQGAVGRMNVKGLDAIIHRIEGELGVLPKGKELVELLKQSFASGDDIQTATFKLIHSLFASYGLIVLIPDNGNLKRVMLEIFKDDLLKQLPSSIVGKTIENLGKHYKVQANPREINLFYLKDNIRERLTQTEDKWKVLGHEIEFSKEELLKELDEFPGRFSPNVILRGLFQEKILPNIAFIGGGGEMAYWFELKELFDHYQVPYPVIILRNSFLIIEQKWKELMLKLRLDDLDLFEKEDEILKQFVNRESVRQLSLETEIETASLWYENLKSVAGTVDETLVQHISALQTKAVKKICELEKKLIRAEKRKFEAENRQISKLKSALFPNNNLQERVDNFMPYYARWGKKFIEMLYHQSLTLEQEFVVLKEDKQ